MSCFSNLKKSLLVSFLFLFSVLSFSLTLNVVDIYAFDDLVISESTSNLTINYSSYKYGIIRNTNSNNYSGGYLSFNYQRFNTYTNFRVYPISDYFVFSLHAPFTITGVTIPSSLSGSVTVTFSNNLPDSFGPTVVNPSGNIDITENGTYDVTNYATATVNVENEVIYGDYHNDLININNSILICGAICLVLYFFYSIYRMIIKSTGSS